MIVGTFLESSKKLTFFVFKEFGRLGIFRLLYQRWALSTNINIIKRINAYYCMYTNLTNHKTNYSKLLYTRKDQNSAHVDMPKDLQMLLPDVAFLTLLMQQLGQLCPTPGPVKGFVRPVFIVAKVSYILTTCPYIDNLEFHNFDAGGPQRHIIASVTITVRIRTLSVHWLKLNLVC